jgi:hypothetical protein
MVYADLTSRNGKRSGRSAVATKPADADVGAGS